MTHGHKVKRMNRNKKKSVYVNKVLKNKSYKIYPKKMSP